MSQIALCFLVTKDLVNLKVWEEWWKGHEHLINIYAHFSTKKNVTQPILLKNRVDPINTKWGDVSLVYAEAKLYKKATLTQSNQFCILLSETCIPVRPFAYIYKRLFRDPNRGILHYRRIDNFKHQTEPFITNTFCNSLIEELGFKGNKVYASDQWKILSRKNVNDFIEMTLNKKWVHLFNRCIKIVPDSLAPDELMFINYLNDHHLLTTIRRGVVTYVDFKKIAIHPIVFKRISPRLSKDICDTNAMFARKFIEPTKTQLLECRR